MLIHNSGKLLGITWRVLHFYRFIYYQTLDYHEPGVKTYEKKIDGLENVINKNPLGTYIILKITGGKNVLDEVAEVTKFMLHLIVFV